jgi:hypothetical protein
MAVRGRTQTLAKRRRTPTPPSSSKAGATRPPQKPSPADAAATFFACDADLEDEPIRAVGTAAVERVLGAEGELASFRRFQDQPAQRDRELHAQLRRFLGTRAGRKVRYGSLLVDALELDRVPPALDLALARARVVARRKLVRFALG